MTVDELRAMLTDLPGDVPVLVADTKAASPRWRMRALPRSRSWIA